MASERALACRKEAEKILEKKTIPILGSIFGLGKEEKYDKASDLYQRAGNEYKMAKDYNSAAEMYEKAAQCQDHVDLGQMQKYRYLSDAANTYKQAKNLEKAVSTFQNIINYYNSQGKYNQSAKMNNEIGDMLKDEDPAGAMTFYETAADLYHNDNPPKKSNGNQCLLKVAEILSVKIKDYKKAADIYEQLAVNSLETKLGAYSAKGHFFNSLLCHLATYDNVNTSIKFSQYVEKDYTFGNSREGDFIEKILKACDDFDADAFEEKCNLYDRISPMNPQMISILLLVKKHNFGNNNNSGKTSNDSNSNSNSGNGNSNVEAAVNAPEDDDDEDLVDLS